VPICGALIWVLGKPLWALGKRFGYITPSDLVADYYKSDTLRVVTGRGANHAAIALFFSELQQLVVSAAQFKGEHWLQVFAFEQNFVASAHG